MAAKAAAAKHAEEAAASEGPDAYPPPAKVGKAGGAHPCPHAHAPAPQWAVQCLIQAA
jgi:hypothetical protein